MILRIGYDIEFEFPIPAAVVALLHLHPTRVVDLRAPDHLTTGPAIATDPYIDGFGNGCTRLLAPKGLRRLTSSTSIYDSGLPDPVSPSAPATIARASGASWWRRAATPPT